MQAIKVIRNLLSSLVLCAMCMVFCSFTVVLDAGHGGKDVGALGEDLQEKEINLEVTKRVGDILKKEMKDVKVVYTRQNDTFIPLQERCNIANKAKGDVFVAIHTNSVDLKSPNRSTVCGASVYTLGLKRSDTNLEVAMRENSVIKLEDDYTSTYAGFDPTSTESYIIFEMARSAHMDQSIRLADYIQNELVATADRKDKGVRQEPFWVLVRTSMPAVLIELDFICNPEVEDFLGSEEGRDKLARAIANGIMQYEGTLKAPGSIDSKKKTKREKKEKVKKEETSAKTVAEPAPEPVTAPALDVLIYKVQFLTSPRKIHSSDSRLADIADVDSYNDNGTEKYTSGSFTTFEEAKKRLNDVKKRYPDAFIIKMQNGKRVK